MTHAEHLHDQLAPAEVELHLLNDHASALPDSLLRDTALVIRAYAYAAVCGIDNAEWSISETVAVYLHELIHEDDDKEECR